MNTIQRRASLLLFFGLQIALIAPWLNAAPRVLPRGEQPNDRRLGPLKDLNGYFPFHVPTSVAAWQQRREELRRRILVACGIWPLPEKTPLNSVIHGRIERDGFTVEKVYFESIPHHFVTGLLFRPVGKTGKLPAVLCPHGHGGRLQDLGSDGVRTAIVNGQERFERSGRYPKLARCGQLARMGCVTFIFDMIGYADSVQLPYELAHRFAKQRPEMNGKDHWGFFGTQAELRLQSIFGLQTWNSVRALDFLCSLPDVDEQRIAVTGGSGGGTQTIMLCAIDPRPSVAFPQGMVSTSMQGGCTCENCSLLRIGTGNVELAALFAPKPQGMTAADDWTREMMTKGFPELQRLYSMLGAADNVMCRPLLHFPHNYNFVTRAVMYSWLNKHLQLGLAEPIVEEDFVPLSEDEQHIWDDQHPRPEMGSAEYEVMLTRWLDADSNRQLAKLHPRDEATWSEYQRVVGGAWRTIFGRSLHDVGPITREKVEKIDCGTYWQFTDLLRATRHTEALPVVSLYPKTREWNGVVVIWIDGNGKRGMFDDAGNPRREIESLLSGGVAVLSADLFGQGEFQSDTDTLAMNRVVDNPREFAGYTFGYNNPMFVQRVHDVMTLISFVQSDEHAPTKVRLAGVGGGAPIVAAANVLSENAVDAAALDSVDFRFVNVQSYRDLDFVPGAVKYGDLPSLLALAAPRPLWIANDGEIPDLVRDAYRIRGDSQAIRTGLGLEGMARGLVSP